MMIRKSSKNLDHHLIELRFVSPADHTSFSTLKGPLVRWLADLWVNNLVVQLQLDERVQRLLLVPREQRALGFQHFDLRRRQISQASCTSDGREDLDNALDVLNGLIANRTIQRYKTQSQQKNSLEI